MEAFLVSIPIFLIITIGWLFRKYRIVDEIWVHILNQFAYYVSLPALIIGSFWNIDFSDPGFLKLAGWSLVVIVALMLVTFLVLSLFKINYKTKTAIFLIICTGNSIYMGFPIIANAFGQGSLAAGSLVAVIYLIAPILASIFVIQLWAKNKNSLSSQIMDFIKNPLTLSAIAGVLISFIPKEISGPDLIYKAINMLGATASPVALFALGSFLYKRLLKRNLVTVFSVSALKVFGFPLVLFYVGANYLSHDVRGLLVLLAAMPTAVTTFIIAEKFSLDDTLVGNALLVSTVLSFFAIPFVLTFII
jgi:predicted permease